MAIRSSVWRKSPGSSACASACSASFGVARDGEPGRRDQRLDLGPVRRVVVDRKRRRCAVLLEDLAQRRAGGERARRDHQRCVARRAMRQARLPPRPPAGPSRPRAARRAGRGRNRWRGISSARRPRPSRRSPGARRVRRISASPSGPIERAHDLLPPVGDPHRVRAVDQQAGQVARAAGRRTTRRLARRPSTPPRSPRSRAGRRRCGRPGWPSAAPRRRPCAAAVAAVVEVDEYPVKLCTLPRRTTRFEAISTTS